MERYYSKRKISTYLLSLFVIVLASSCTVYQNVPNDDGIYSSEKKEPRVIVENSDEHREYEDNYFSKELERLDQINGTDILTDIDNYSSLNDTIPNLEDDINTTPTNRAWGYNDSDDVVININLDNGFYPRWGWGVDPYSFWGGSWWWRNPWGWDYWGSYYNGIYCPPYWVWGSRPWGFRPYRNWVRSWRYSPYGGGPRYYGRRGVYAYGGTANRFIAYEYYNWRRTTRRAANDIYNPRAYNSRRAVYSTRNNSTSTRRSSNVYRNRNTSTRSNTRTRATNTRTRSTNTRPRTRITRGNTRNTNTRARSNNTRTRSNVNRSRSSSRNRSSYNRSSSRSRSSANRSSRSSSSRSRASSRSSSSRSRGSSSRGSSRKRG
ncbi:hypothetical protein [Pseudotenacibaculum haliotis]|uniref:Vitellogenin II n=1 Tax=Pseudotenacibaculum haliotis TaxID=1862138 RepID=A0ABW5LNX7_9FLAO